MRNFKNIMAVFAATTVLALPVNAPAQVQAQMSASALPTINAPSEGPISTFIPQSQTSKTRLDYGVLNDALYYSVLPLGPSTRRRMGRVEAQTGTRSLTGHRSPYRLEGSRISFSLLNDDYKGALKDYQKDLERIGSEVDLTRMSRNEQLAYWFNLHNVTMIAKIVEEYPVRRPSKLKVNGVPLDEAKILTVKNVPLSLKDIRERIVYPNWKNPNVIYGFFRGDIGSPGILDSAFTGQNLNSGLKTSATEFVNSLRGVHEISNARKVSRIYQEAAPYYFPNFEADLERHLLVYAREDVRPEIVAPKPMAIDKYDDVVADLVGGSRPSIARGTVRDADGDVIPISYELAQLMREFEQKRTVLKRRGLIQSGGTVIIEDIDTSSSQVYDPNVDPESSAVTTRPTTGL